MDWKTLLTLAFLGLRATLIRGAPSSSNCTQLCELTCPEPEPCCASGEKLNASFDECGCAITCGRCLTPNGFLCNPKEDICAKGAKCVPLLQGEDTQANQTNPSLQMGSIHQCMDKTRATLMRAQKQIMMMNNTDNPEMSPIDLAMSQFMHSYQLENDTDYYDRGALFSPTQTCNKTFDEQGLILQTYAILTNALEGNESSVFSASPGFVNHSLGVLFEVVKLTQETTQEEGFKLMKIVPLLEGLGKLQIDFERIFNGTQLLGDDPNSGPNSTDDWMTSILYTSSPVY